MYNLNQIAVYLALGLTFVPLIRCEQIFSVHGSGTTNPSKCFWNIMSRIQEQSHAFTRLTYRAVGSGTGQIEFIGKFDETVTPKPDTPPPANDFGSGDIPLSLEDYEKLQNINGSTVVHLPFVVSGVSFFHSVPNVPKGKGGLNLTSCLLAQIFSGEILVWDDSEILEQNPNLLEMLPNRNYPIGVAHRVEGSSSTKSITQYLNLKCPTFWPSNQVSKKGKDILWAPNSLSCDSSGQMTTCIRENEGTIGYIDSGHGWEEDLTEIELQNADGNFVSSLDSFRSGGTGVAATVATKDLKSFDESFHAISLLDQEGSNTWPILVMSYVYVRTNVEQYLTRDNLGLLSIFLQALYNPLYIDTCKDFGFTPVPTDVREKALKTLDEKVDFIIEDWSFEVGIEKILGQGAKKISPKRRDYGEFERSRLNTDVAGLSAQSAISANALERLSMLESETIEKLLNLAENEKVMMQIGSGSDNDSDSGSKAALVLASISFVLWCVALLYMIVTKCFLHM